MEIKLQKRYKYVGDILEALVEKAGFPLDVAGEFLNGIKDAEVIERRRGEWIPVTERLPDRDAVVLAYFPEMEGTESRIQTQKGWSVTKFCSHWMPLPEPPKGV